MLKHVAAPIMKAKAAAHLMGADIEGVGYGALELVLALTALPREPWIDLVEYLEGFDPEIVAEVARFELSLTQSIPPSTPGVPEE